MAGAVLMAGPLPVGVASIVSKPLQIVFNQRKGR